jgi:hypothetical protein
MNVDLAKRIQHRMQSIVSDPQWAPRMDGGADVDITWILIGIIMLACLLYVIHAVYQYMEKSTPTKKK